MAKATKATDGVQKGSNKMYIIAGIFFAFEMLLCMYLFNSVYSRMNISATNSEAARIAVDSIKEELVNINKNITGIIGGIWKSSDTSKSRAALEDIQNDIDTSFEKIEKNLAIYEELNFSGDGKRGNTVNLKEKKRYEQAKSYISALKNKYKENYSELSNGSDDAKNIYAQEIEFYQQSATQMFDVATTINKISSMENRAFGRRVYITVIIIMCVMIVITEVAIAVVAHITHKNAAEIEAKRLQAEAANKKFKHSQEKINDIAYTNILTGMKNRYALENDIGEKLGSDSFNIAVFDMDNFRSINDIYGYDFGDEYLVQVSERLKNEFGQYAEIYNIIGNEFCVVYNKEIPDGQAMQISENIFGAISSMYNVANIGIQLTVSGSTYHYLPGECMNVSGLLVKMDGVIRNIKRNGGNSVQKVMGI